MTTLEIAGMQPDDQKLI